MTLQNGEEPPPPQWPPGSTVIRGASIRRSASEPYRDPSGSGRARTSGCLARNAASTTHLIDRRGLVGARPRATEWVDRVT